MEEWPGFSQVPDEDLIPLARPEGQALSKHVWWNGSVKPAAEQGIHYYANALHYGTAAFEGIRCYPTPTGPALLRLKDHMERLKSSAALYGMRLKYSVEQLCHGALEVARRNGATNAYLRPIAFFGYGPIDLTPKKACNVEVMIATRELGSFLGETALRNGIKATVATWRKFPLACMPTMAKISGHYANHVLAAHEAADRGADDAILLNMDGTVSSSTGGNVFFTRNLTLVTNDESSGIIPGITRDCVLSLANSAGVKTEIRPFGREELLRADEVFITGTAAEVTPVRALDYQEFRTGKGTLGAHLQRVYLAAATGRDPSRTDWLSPL